MYVIEGYGSDRAFVERYLITFLEANQISFNDCIDVLKQCQEHYQKLEPANVYKIVEKTELEKRYAESFEDEYTNPADTYACTSNPNTPCIHHEIKLECDELRNTILEKDVQLEALKSQIEASTKMIESLLANVDTQSNKTLKANKLNWFTKIINSLFK
jgi:hypothetical protein